MSNMSRLGIIRIDVSRHKATKIEDWVATERPLHVFLNQTHYVTIHCSPSNLKELAVGNALSEGTLQSIDEISEVQLENEELCRIKLDPRVNLKRRLDTKELFSRVIISTCGEQRSSQLKKKTPKTTSHLTLTAETLLSSVKQLNSSAEAFKKTGGVHAAAVCAKDGTLLKFAEDIGRHNAVDKVIGSAALDHIDLTHCFLTLTGRLTADIVLKAARVGLSLVASMAAAIDSGITVSREADVTLIGFVRGQRMNVYNGAQRVVI